MNRLKGRTTQSNRIEMKNKTNEPIDVEYKLRKWKWKDEARRTYVVEVMEGKNTPLGR